MRRLLEVLGNQVAEGVILLEEDKVRCIGQAWESQFLGAAIKADGADKPVKIFSVIFFSPSWSRKSSNLGPTRQQDTRRRLQKFVCIRTGSRPRHCGKETTFSGNRRRLGGHGKEEEWW